LDAHLPDPFEYIRRSTGDTWYFFQYSPGAGSKISFETIAHSTNAQASLGGTYGSALPIDATSRNRKILTGP
jgi:hypothetical protein